MKGRIYNKTGFFGGAGAGLRRFEIVALDVGDWDPAEQSLRVAHGKGDRPRTVYLSDSGARCLAKWLDLTHDNDPNKSGHVVQKRNSQLKHEKRTLLQSC